MKTLSTLLVLSCLSLALNACSSSTPEAPAGDLSVPCTCGDPYADMEGCAFVLCMDGSGNPDNPECVCGPMSLNEEGE